MFAVKFWKIAKKRYLIASNSLSFGATVRALDLQFFPRFEEGKEENKLGNIKG